MQNYKTLCAPPDTGSRPSIDVHPYFPLLILRKALTELRDKVTEVCDRESTKISELGEYKYTRYLRLLNTEVLSSTVDTCCEFYQLLMHKWLLTADTAMFTVDAHDQSAESSSSCPLNAETGTDTHIPPSKWVIKPHQVNHVHRCKLKHSWRNSTLWPFPAHTHLQQTELRTRGDFLQCEFWFDIGYQVQDNVYPAGDRKINPDRVTPWSWTNIIPLVAWLFCTILSHFVLEYFISSLYHGLSE